MPSTLDVPSHVTYLLYSYLCSDLLHFREYAWFQALCNWFSVWNWLRCRGVDALLGLYFSFLRAYLSLRALIKRTCLLFSSFLLYLRPCLFVQVASLEQLVWVFSYLDAQIYLGDILDWRSLPLFVKISGFETNCFGGDFTQSNQFCVRSNLRWYLKREEWRSKLAVFEYCLLYAFLPIYSRLLYVGTYRFVGQRPKPHFFLLKYRSFSV